MDILSYAYPLLSYAYPFFPMLPGNFYFSRLGRMNILVPLRLLHCTDELIVMPSSHHSRDRSPGCLSTAPV